MMKKLLIFSCLCLSLNFASAQKDTTKDYDVEFSAVQVEASFPGGASEWRKYLERNLNTSLADSCHLLKKKQKSAKQTVVIAFQVDKEGNISDAHAENAQNLCPLLVQEAIRVITKGPKWVPATQNGRAVIYRQRQSITWVLTEE